MSNIYLNDGGEYCINNKVFVYAPRKYVRITNHYESIGIIICITKLNSKRSSACKSVQIELMQTSSASKYLSSLKLVNKLWEFFIVIFMGKSLMVTHIKTHGKRDSNVNFSAGLAGMLVNF